jgi:hypothetical protein
VNLAFNHLTFHIVDEEAHCKVQLTEDKNYCLMLSLPTDGGSSRIYLRSIVIEIIF